MTLNAILDRQLINVLARLIRDNHLHETNREDTIGVLMRCGAFYDYPEGLVALAEAIDMAKIDYIKEPSPAKKLTFGELAVGDHFIAWPLPGDNSGHGGYLGAQRLFVKVDAGQARDGRGVASMYPSTMYVIQILLG